MFKINLYNQLGKAIGKVDLDPDVFSLKPKEEIIHQVFAAQANNMRPVIAHTKTRSERRGGGRKPWRQKGTGRARAGSNRSPIWRKGGIIFGPRNTRNFKVNLNRKLKKQAICMTLSDKVKAEELKVIDRLSLTEFKTKKAEKILSNLSLDAKTLIVLEKPIKSVIKSFANLANIKVINFNQLNVMDLVNYQSLLIVEPALTQITKLYKK